MLAALAVSCAPTRGVVAPTSPPGQSGLSTSSASSSASASTPKPADLAQLSIALVRRWRGFNSPLYLTNAGDGSRRLFVVEQGGTVRVIRNDRVAPRPYLDIRSLVLAGGERGLLGIAFAPHFADNGHVYVDYTDTNGDTVVARYTAQDPASDAPTWGVPQTLLHIAQPFANHNGGCVQFGPDGYLWIGMGDGGSAGDPGNRAQNPRILLGKMLRIDVEGPKAGAGYAIPAGQPVKAGWAPEVWMIGLRNPWRFSFDASTGAAWIGDVGQDAWEEIDLASAGVGGQNWGWHVWEGLRAYPPGSSASKAGFSFPIAEYPHPDGESITGGYVYRGVKYPALVGTYLYADYIKGWLAGLRVTSPDGRRLGTAQTRTLLTNIGQPSSFGVDEAGELYMVDYQGSVLQVTAQAR